ncbi:MAG: hypothetical protein ACLQK4_08545 [Acidimicrobiales bacterium]|jgi:hypothetical protein
MERQKIENETNSEASPTTRRAILLGGAAGLATVAAVSLAKVSPAGAASGDDMVLGDLNNAGEDETNLISSTGGATLGLINTGGGWSLWASDNGDGEWGDRQGWQSYFRSRLQLVQRFAGGEGVELRREQCRPGRDRQRVER